MECHQGQGFWPCLGRHLALEELLHFFAQYKKEVVCI